MFVEGRFAERRPFSMGDTRKMLFLRFVGKILQNTPF